MEFPKLSPEYIRREARPDYEAEIWQPDWKCFCCHDYGTVVSHLVTKVIPEFDHFRHKHVLCQDPGCDAGKGLKLSPIMGEQLDRRFDSELCAQLDEYERQNWKDTVKNKHQRAVDIAALTSRLAMKGTKSRTENDEREIEIKKQEAQAKLDSQKQQAMSRYSRLQELQEELEPDSQEHLGF